MKKKQLIDTRKEIDRIAKIFDSSKNSYVQGCEEYFLASNEVRVGLRRKLPGVNWVMAFKIGSGEVNPDLYALDIPIARKLIYAPREIQDRVLSGEVDICVKNSSGEYDVRKIPFYNWSRKQQNQLLDFSSGECKLRESVAAQRTWLDEQEKQDEKEGKMKVSVSHSKIIVHPDSKTVEIVGNAILNEKQLHDILAQFWEVKNEK